MYPDMRYSITFIDADITRPEYYPDLLKEVLDGGEDFDGGFDFYYQRAGVTIPALYSKFIPRLYNSMNMGGCFITDDYGLSPKGLYSRQQNNNHAVQDLLSLFAMESIEGAQLYWERVEIPNFEQLEFNILANSLASVADSERKQMIIQQRLSKRQYRYGWKVRIRRKVRSSRMTSFIVFEAAA